MDKPGRFLVMQSVNVTHPPKKGTVKCGFGLKCGKVRLSSKREAIQIVSINGTGPHIEWGCIPCARVVVLQHMSRVAKFQGYLMDALNKVNAVEYFTNRVTSKTPGYETPLVRIHYPTADQLAEQHRSDAPIKADEEEE